MKTLIAVTRGSALAVAQTEIVIGALKIMEAEVYIVLVAGWRYRGVELS